MHLLHMINFRFVWQNAFKVSSSFSLAQSVWHLGVCKVGCQNIPTLTAARPGWVILKVSGSSLPIYQFLAASPVNGSEWLLPSIHLHVELTIFRSSASHCKRRSKLWLFFHSHDDSTQPDSSTSSEPLVLGLLLKKVNKPARNLPVPAKSWDLRILKVALLSVRLAQNSAWGMRGRCSTGKHRIVLF